MATSRATTRKVRQAAAQRPRVVAGYIRLTEDRDGNKIGKTIQRAEIVRWAKAHGYEVVFFEDEDITAAKLEVVRPEYEKMLARVVAGEFVGVVVWRLDRLVRLTREFERCFGVIEDAGAFVQDIDQGINSKKEIGMLFMRLLVIMAEMEISTMRTRARAHQQRKAELGKVCRGGHRPFGFVGVIKDPKTGAIANLDEALIKHDPGEAALIREAADRILRHGATHMDICRDWAKRNPPVCGTTGKPMDNDSLRGVLGNARTAGLREYEIVDEETGEITVDYADAEWDGILDRATWEALRAQRRQYTRQGVRSDRILSGGLIRCGNCGRPMVPSTTMMKKGHPNKAIYQCNMSMRGRIAGSCGSGAIRAEDTEQVVLKLLFARLEESPDLLDQMAKSSGEDEERSREREEARAELEVCNRELGSLGERQALPKSDPMSLDSMEAAGMRKGYRDRKEKAELTLAGLARLAGHRVPVGSERDDLEGWFAGLGVGEKRSFLAAHIQDVIVRKQLKRAGPFFDPSRVDTVFAGAKVADGQGD